MADRAGHHAYWHRERRRELFPDYGFRNHRRGWPCRECNVVIVGRRCDVSLAASTQFVARDRFDKRDDALPQAWLLYLHERLGEREPVDRGEKFGHIRGQ